MTVLIAEIGENHLGDIDRAARMVREAAASGVDIVKFQSYRAQDVTPGDPEKEWFAKVELSDNAHFILRDVALQSGVQFMSAPFTVERAKFLCEKLELDKIKIASSEMLNVPLLDYVNLHAHTVFLSTGLANLEEVSRSVDLLKNVKELYLLHCVTQYPTAPENVNLLCMETFAQCFPWVNVGYSDHTIGNRAAIAAAAMGAHVIEKHFTLDKNLPGTDHILSADPFELRTLVEEIRAINVLRGRRVKRPTSGEESIKDFVRARFSKSLL